MGTLIAPLLGVVGDRLGRRTMLYTMRALFAALAAIIMVLAFADMLNVYYVLAAAFLNGLLRPSDLVMRNALIADTVSQDGLANALGLARTNMDSAKIFGALAGAGLFAALGIGVAYIGVTAVYLMGLILTFGVSRVHPSGQALSTGDTTPLSPSYWRELREGLVYIWNTPAVLAIMWLAFLVNLTAFPITHGLLPYVAREIYLIDENGLGHIVAAFGCGALIGSLAVAWMGRQRSPLRVTLINILLWYAMLAVFAQFDTKLSGAATLFVMGIVHSLGMVSMSVALLAVLDSKVRGRVMGVRILAIYGVPIGMLSSGFLIESFGFAAFVSIYVAIGAAVTVLIALRWRRAIWQ
jgi:predicted MFS family arabinose efflux permease